MKSDAERGRWGRFLRDQRTKRGLSQEEVRARLLKERGFAAGESSYAEWESGYKKQPPKDAQAHFIAMWKAEPEPEVRAAPPVEGDVAAAIREQTAAISALVEEMRLAREAASERDVVQARFLEGLARQSAAGVSEEQSEFGALPKGQE